MGAFQYEGTQEAQAIHSRIPSTTEILLTHTPPHGICDKTKRRVHAGCAVLATQLNKDEFNHCRLHVFGHIHEAHGTHVAGLGAAGERVSVNAAMPDSEVAVIVDLLN